MPKRSKEFRFYDSRQKYLLFVTTCSEKWAIAERAGEEIPKLRPTPPALRLFDAGMGDGTVVTQIMRQLHRQFPTVPLLCVAKEISVEDVRLTVDKLPDRFLEHPQTVFVVTNMLYREAPWLTPRDTIPTSDLIWREVALQGDTTHAFHEQIQDLHEPLADDWRVEVDPKTGNPRYARPAVLLLYREDHRFALDGVIPKRGEKAGGYDLVLASQPYQARASAEFKVRNVLAPLARSLAPGGRMSVVQSAGDDPGMELIHAIWPDEQPFTTNRRALIEELRRQVGGEGLGLSMPARDDQQAIFRFTMHTLPSEVGDNIGTSTVLAAWNAATYVAQIDDGRYAEVTSSGRYIEAAQAVLREHGGLWFNDECFTVVRARR